MGITVESGMVMLPVVAQRSTATRAAAGRRARSHLTRRGPGGTELARLRLLLRGGDEGNGEDGQAQQKRRSH
jgi:hypothetical protein